MLIILNGANRVAFQEPSGAQRIILAKVSGRQSVRMRRTLCLLTFMFLSTMAFPQPSSFVRSPTVPLMLVSKADSSSDDDSMRRSLLVGGATSFLLGALSLPSVSLAVVDVSGLPVEGGASMKSQLQTYSSATTTSSTNKSSPSTSAVSSQNPYEDSKGATFALRYGPGATLTKIGLARTTTRYQDQVLTSTQRPVSISFEFPSDWLQLDKYTGGIQYVDQRNGDKLYVLRATLPDAENLDFVSKKWFGTVLFNPQGSLVTTGNDVEDYKVSSSSSSTQLVPCGAVALCNASRRRLGAKYSTVTGNGLHVERRGLIDAYQVDRDVIMMVTSTNAVKFDKAGPERETAEAIVESFRVGQ